MKTCAMCGRLFARASRMADAQWERRKFCSHACMQKARQPPRARCETCQSEFPRHSRGKQAPRRFCSMRCAQANKPVNPVTTRYRVTKVDGKKKQKHRAIMEAELGRPLRRDELVHHQNENKLDNSASNLEVMDPVTHGRHHHLKYPLTKTCMVCGVVFTPHKTKRKRAKTCGVSCGAVLANRTRAEKKC